MLKIAKEILDFSCGLVTELYSTDSLSLLNDSCVYLRLFVCECVRVGHLGFIHMHGLCSYHLQDCFLCKSRYRKHVFWTLYGIMKIRKFDVTALHFMLTFA